MGAEAKPAGVLYPATYCGALHSSTLPVMNQPPLFAFESRDALAQWLVWVIPLLGGGLIVSMLLDVGGVRAVMAAVVAATVVVMGLRSSISVTQAETKIVRKWFFLPYWSYRATEIQDVWYGGDWGNSEGAIGVVVKLGGKEVHIGTSKNMRELHNALFRLSARYRELNPASASSPLAEGKDAT